MLQTELRQLLQGHALDPEQIQAAIHGIITDEIPLAKLERFWLCYNMQALMRLPCQQL